MTFRTLKSLPCDVFLGAHGGYFGMEAKFARMKPGGANPFVDPEGYKSYVAGTGASVSQGAGEAVGSHGRGRVDLREDAGCDLRAMGSAVDFSFRPIETGC